MVDRAVAAKNSGAQCLILPRRWLFEKEQNLGNVWQRYVHRWQSFEGNSLTRVCLQNQNLPYHDHTATGERVPRAEGREQMDAIQKECDRETSMPSPHVQSHEIWRHSADVSRSTLTQISMKSEKENKLNNFILNVIFFFSFSSSNTLFSRLENQNRHSFFYRGKIIIYNLKDSHKKFHTSSIFIYFLSVR